MDLYRGGRDVLLLWICKGEAVLCYGYGSVKGRQRCVMVMDL
jgi:hypothetical protein